jgi:hypothetical protein
MSNVVNREGLNLELLGYTSKREYFGGESVVFRRVEAYVYDYVTTDLANYASGLSPLIASGISGQIANFSGDVTIRGLDIPNSYDSLEEQIRTARYKITVEVRTSIGSGDSNYYTGLNYITQSGFAALDGFSESFDFENAEDAQKLNHSISFSLRTGDMGFAQALASGLMQESEPQNLGIGVLSGYLGQYNDASSENYYTEAYDTFKNTYSFKKTKNLYKITGVGFTFDTNTRYEFNDGISTVIDEIKVRGKQNFTQASDGLNALIGSSESRCADVYGAYQGFSNLDGAGTLFSTPLKKVLKYNQQALAAEASLTFTDNPLYANDYKLDEVMNLTVDQNGIVKVTDDYTMTLLDFVDSDMASTHKDEFNNATRSDFSQTQSNKFYASFLYGRSLYPVGLTKKLPLRKRVFTANYEYSDDPRYGVTLTSISGATKTFPNVDMKLTETAPKDSLTEYKVINKPETLVNYAYQQVPGSKTMSITAIRTRPDGNQLVSLDVPVTEVQCLYATALNKISQTFENFNGLNYFLSNVVVNLNSENKLELNATVSYTKKKYV